MEVGEQCVGVAESEAWLNQELRVAAIGAVCSAPRCRKTFDRADSGGSDCHTTSSCTIAMLQRLNRGRGNLDPLAVHVMLFKRRGFDGFECACANMQQHICTLHAASRQDLKQFGSEVQASGGRGD